MFLEYALSREMTHEPLVLLFCVAWKVTMNFCCCFVIINLLFFILCGINGNDCCNVIPRIMSYHIMHPVFLSVHHSSACMLDGCNCFFFSTHYFFFKYLGRTRNLWMRRSTLTSLARQNVWNHCSSIRYFAAFWKFEVDIAGQWKVHYYLKMNYS